MSRPLTPDEVLAQEARERAAVATLSDSDVLARAGTMGPGLIGTALFERAAAVRKRTGGGVFGPAIVDPDHGKPAKAPGDRRAPDQPAAMGDAFAEGRLPEADRRAHDDEDEEEETETSETPAPDPAEGAGVDDPWSQVTLSGAKMLAQEKQVSYQPRVKRADLIAQLIAAGIQPPPKAPELPDDDPEHV